MIGPAVRWTQRTIARQWDLIAVERDAQMRSGEDLSYSNILVPTVISLSRKCVWKTVLDAGCGSGVLTEQLATHAGHVTGIDISRGSVRLAMESSRKRSNVEYIHTSVESFAKHKAPRFSLAVANMVLQDVPNLNNFVQALGRLVEPSGCLVVTITHPMFWPAYWNYFAEPWFHYEKEIAILAPFKISLREDPVGWTTHFHRPLHLYIDALRSAGFAIDKIVEPMPSESIAIRYPLPWRFPRFLGLRCIREGQRPRKATTK